MKNDYDDDEECFMGSSIELETIKVDNNFTNFQIDKIQLPSANQLRTSTRPNSMVPRTLFKQIQYALLPSILNNPCQQGHVEEDVNTKKLKVYNSQRYDIPEFLTRDRVALIYKKFKNDANITIDEEKTGRTKQIISFNDYDETLFKQLKQYKQQQQKFKKDEDIIDSNFQSGNLYYAYKTLREREYYLLLQKDVNTHGYNNWFFFRVKNKIPGVRRFHIINIVKKTSLYKQGMKISIFSMKKQKKQNIQWFLGGSNITFSESNFFRFYHPNEKYSTLSFQYNFQYENDQVYFAMNEPYTYTRAIQMLKNFERQIQEEGESDPLKIEFELKNIGYTISNNIIPAVNIYKNEKDNKPILMFLGRQHPAQTVGSFVIEGIVQEFRKNTPHSNFLLQNFLIVIIPMVNPDGVIHGNSRCNLAGLDLNRNWGNQTLKDISPETVKVRSYIVELQKNGHEIKYLIDSHGHGKKLNSFFFVSKNEDRFSHRYFSQVMSKLEERFNLYSCMYGLSKDKQFSIRGQFQDLGIQNGFTLENSYYGYEKNNRVLPYLEKDLKQIGVSLLKSLHILEDPQSQQIKDLYGFNKGVIHQQLLKNIDQIEKEERKNTYRKDDLSDSDPEADKFEPEEAVNLYKQKREKETKKIKSIYHKPENQSKKKKSKNKIPPVKKQSKKKERKSPCSEDESEKQQVEQAKRKGFTILRKKKNLIQQKYLIKKQLKSKLTSPTNKKLEIKIDNIQRKQQNIKEHEQKSPQRFTFSALHRYAATTKNPRYLKNVQKAQNNDKGKIFSQIKTQLSCPTPSIISQIRKQDRQKSVLLNKTFTQLKQESLKIILKDTISILGVGNTKKKFKFIDDKKPSRNKTFGSEKISSTFYPPNEKKQQRLKISVKSQKKVKAQSILSEEKLKLALTQKIKRQKAFKRFESFINKKDINDETKKRSTQNSIFYFPIK